MVADAIRGKSIKRTGLITQAMEGNEGLLLLFTVNERRLIRQPNNSGHRKQCKE